MNNVRRQAAVDWRCGPEPNGRIKIINTKSRGATVGIRNTGFHTDSVSLLEILHFLSGCDNRSGRFVSEHHGCIDDKRTNLAVLIVVNIASTDTNRVDGDLDIVGAKLLRQFDISE